MKIHIEGANEHNLRDVDVEIGDGLTVVTGVSGSGKTSLVFDTLYHEARRRFLEIFSLGERLSPANVRAIRGLGPAVAVGQNLLNRNPGSTLATASGLHPFLRLFYTHFGERVCTTCGTPVAVHTEDEIVERLVALLERESLVLFAPLVRQGLGSYRMLLALLVRQYGPEGVWVDGAPIDQALPRERLSLDPEYPHDIDVVVAQPVHDKTETAPALAKAIREGVRQAWALGATAVAAIPEAAPAGSAATLFSRAPVCARCGAWFHDVSPVHFHSACPHCAGGGCDRCGETGLHPIGASVRWQGLRLPDLLALSVEQVQGRFAATDVPSTAARLEREIKLRLDALAQVGLGYLALDRPSPTLSRGESQRVRLAVALTSQLEDILHVLDEPTIGQHPADVARLLPAFRELLGPVVYVEHDRMAAAAADYALDLGPGAGPAGGEVTFSGTPEDLWASDTATGRAFSLRDKVMLPESRAAPEAFLTVRGAHLRTLRHIDVPIPLGRLTVVTGVSGSGKSTLVEDVLAASLMDGAVGCDAIDGPRLKIVVVDQNPIGRNPRSNPATYTKLSDIVRDAFATATGLSASHGPTTSRT
jgi:excinuclease ABC subunit A